MAVLGLAIVSAVAACTDSSEAGDDVSGAAGVDGALQPPRERGPDQVVGVTDDGRLVVVDLLSGDELVELAGSDQPDRDGATSGPHVIDFVTVSPDGEWAWYSTCCRLSERSVFRVPTDGSRRPARVVDGSRPQLSPSGEQVAVVFRNRARILDTATGEVLAEWFDAHFSSGVRDIAWSADERQLAIRVGDPDVGDVVLLDLRELPNPGNGPVDLTPRMTRLVDAGTLALPTFRRDGLLLVAEQHQGSRWRARLVDPHSGDAAKGALFHYRSAPLSQTFDPSGEWLLFVAGGDDGAAGTVHWRTPRGATRTIAGLSFRAAAWKP